MKTRNVIIAVAVGLVVVLALAGLLVGGAMWSRSDYHHSPSMMWGEGVYGGMHSFGGGVVMMLFWGLVLAALVGGGVLLVGSLTRKSRGPIEEEETPLEILKRRYALGEIDRDEYNQMKETLYG
jgi:putative membrane protein